LHNAAQTLVVKFIGRGASRASAEHRADGDGMIFFLYVLMDGVVGEAREGKASAGDENLNLIRGRQPLDAVKDGGSSLSI
jgi:hypothetical protein